jgi:uncharacterized 2Fe-2S/4Fe-4S cluster protein (DUF4445 family)
MPETYARTKSWLIDLDLTAPTPGDNTADADRVIKKIREQLKTDAVKIGFNALQKLPFVLRRHNYQVKCVVFQDCGTWEVISVLGKNQEKKLMGIAIDLGTTRVVMRLIDLETHETKGELSLDNPQIQIGPDVLTRIHYSEKEDGLEKIRLLLVKGMNGAIKSLVQSCGVSNEDVYIAAVSGNTVMTHLFLGIYPGNIIREPYIPVTNTPGVISACQLGIDIYRYGKLFVFPNIGSYFGGDLISGLLYSGMHKSENVSILVDVGTNAEVVLGNRDWLIGCAGAAGPALEGGVSGIGMMAGEGVIDRVRVDEKTGELSFTTIAGGKPIGICGSGFIDLAAALFLTGALDIRGRLVPDNGKHVKEIDGMNHYVIVPAENSGTRGDLLLSQASVDSLIRSKAAMYTILDTISLTVGISLQEPETFYVAGTFGSFIDPVSAITIGMLPDIPLAKYKTLGNSSLEGATLFLKDRNLGGEIDQIRNKITYLELNVDQGFMNRFSGAKFIPHTNRDLFPSVVH